MFGIIVSLTKEPRSPQLFGEQRVSVAHAGMDAFFSWTRTAIARCEARQGRRALFTLTLRLTPFAAIPQSFPWRRAPRFRSQNGARRRGSPTGCLSLERELFAEARVRGKPMVPTRGRLKSGNI
jgi:hypothetical protein